MQQAWQKRIPKIRRVSQIVSKTYQNFNHYNLKNPLWELIFALCSTQTNEANYRRAFQALRRRFGSFKQIATANVKELTRVLRPGGLAPRKAREIQGILQVISGDFGRLTLAPLKQMSDAMCEDYLTKLPGIGPKVARCVMMYALGRDVFPVDVHCWRISVRLGWIRKYKDTRNGRLEAMRILERRIPANLRHSLHVNLVSLGREYCRLKPLCSCCPLCKICPKIGAPPVVKRSTRS